MIGHDQIYQITKFDQNEARQGHLLFEYNEYDGSLIAANILIQVVQKSLIVYVWVLMCVVLAYQCNLYFQQLMKYVLGLNVCLVISYFNKNKKTIQILKMPNEPIITAYLIEGILDTRLFLIANREPINREIVSPKNSEPKIEQKLQLFTVIYMLFMLFIRYGIWLN